MRIIARLDVKPPYLIKPVQFEGLRKIGLARDFALKYYQQGADEILYSDVVASLFNNSINFDEIKALSKGILVPLAAGGGVRTVDDFYKLLNSGVDKVVLNTFAFKQPDLINLASSKCGSQSVVIHIEAKKSGSNYECYTDCGRIPTGKSVSDWAIEVEKRGAGEIVVSSVDKDGMKNGFDIDLIKLVMSKVTIPVIASSGAGSNQDILNLINTIRPDAIAIGTILHYNITSIKEIKEFLTKNGVDLSK